MSWRKAQRGRPGPWARRAWMRGVGVGVGVGLWGGVRGLAGAAGSGPGGEQKSGAAKPKLLLIGDSMIAGGFGLYLAQDLEKAHGLEVVRQGKSSTGLARPDFYDWIEVGAKLVVEHQPDAVACMFGGNDGQGLYMGRDAEPKWIRYTDAGWTAEYRRRVNRFADAVTSAGQRLLWIGMPVMRPPKLHGRVEHMNTIFRAEMAIRPEGHFIDVWRTLADEAGAYTDHVRVDGKRVRVRAGDGVHMSRSGAHYLADLLQADIAERVRAAASVRQGASSAAKSSKVGDGADGRGDEASPTSSGGGLAEPG